MELRVRVPASSANLGPGFDAFAVALPLLAEYEVRPARAWTVEAAAVGAGAVGVVTSGGTTGAAGWFTGAGVGVGAGAVADPVAPLL